MATGVEIVGYARTPVRGFVSDLSSVLAPELDAHALSSALSRAAVVPGDIDALLMRYVLTAGFAQAPARQVRLGAGLPDDPPACTINKVCGSEMRSAALGFDPIRAGTARIVVAGGMRSMPNAPHLVRSTRTGIRTGDCDLEDRMDTDGRAEADEGHSPIGVFAVNKRLARVGRSSRDVDPCEVSAAFAVVALAFLRETRVPSIRLNVNGRTFALGHPVWASCAWIIVTLVAAREELDLARGVAAICIGGGEAIAVAIEWPPGRPTAKEKP